MMIGEAHRHHNHAPPWSESLNPTVQISSSPSLSSSPPQSNGGNDHSPTYYDAVLASLRRYLLAGSSEQEVPSSPTSVGEYSGNDVNFPLTGDYDDDFFMYDFKVKRCTRVRAHDWTECPFAHPGEKARRRDPRKYNYSGTACSEFRKGNCRKGDVCEFAHGVFECWLHPSRFRTQACKDGPGCKRRVCFFAHSADQLRASGSGLTSPRTPYSVSEDGFRSGVVAELAASLRSLQLNKVKSIPNSSWVNGCGSPVFGSPRGGGMGLGSPVSRAGFFSLPTTPTRPVSGFWDTKEIDQEEPIMERVESGRELRARMFEKLSKENPLNGSVLGPGLASGSNLAPDFGWVSDLIE